MLLGAPRETARIEALTTRDEVDAERLGVLRPRPWAVFRPSVERHLERRTDPEHP